jgi:hypothetical protein
LDGRSGYQILAVYRDSKPGKEILGIGIYVLLPAHLLGMDMAQDKNAQADAESFHGMSFFNCYSLDAMIARRCDKTCRFLFFS